jgi:hypothetical protein|tara:strand:- start:4288 stop:5172 length:885 start_codon:yes stop_codon:yes gene_type:complete
MGILSGGNFEAIMQLLRKMFKGKPANIADLNKTARNLGLNENEVDNVVRAFKAEEVTNLNKVDEILTSTSARNQSSAETFNIADASKVDDANLTKAFDRVDATSGDDLLRQARTAEIDMNPAATIEGTIIEPATDFVPARVIKDPSDVKGLGNLKGPAGRNNTDEIIGMPDGIQRSIKFVGERTGLPDSIVQKAIKIKMLEGYEAGNYKGLANDTEDMKAFVDNQIMGDDTLEFLEDIEQIGKELIDSRGVGSMTEAFDTAMDTKTRLDKAAGGLIPPQRGPMPNGIGGMFKKK